MFFNIACPFTKTSLAKTSNTLSTHKPNLLKRRWQSIASIPGVLTKSWVGSIYGFKRGNMINVERVGAREYHSYKPQSTLHTNENTAFKLTW